VIQAIIGRSPVGQIDPSGESFNSRIDPLLDSLKKKLKSEAAGTVIALVPGSFKPPHKGHFAMIDHFASLADKTIVVIGNPQNPKSIRRTPVKNLEITPDQAQEILKIYTEGRPVEYVITPQPIKYVYDYIADKTQPGQKILLGVSGKGDDASRYDNAQKYAPDGVEVEPSVFMDSDLNISAGDLRRVIDDLDPNFDIESGQRDEFINNRLSPYLPDHLNDDQKYRVFDILSQSYLKSLTKL
jgi:cytidyltransferase-like protein